MKLMAFMQRYVIGFSLSRVLRVAGVVFAIMIVADQVIDGRGRWRRIAIGSGCDCSDCLQHYPVGLKLEWGFAAHETTHLFDANTGVRGPIVALGAAGVMFLTGYVSRGRRKREQTGGLDVRAGLNDAV